MKPPIAERRRLQLRKAKQAQRARERAGGLVHVQLALPRALAAKLRRAHRSPDFLADLEQFLDGLVVRVADFPALKQLAWNLHDEYLPARTAFALYERNWKHLDRARLDPREERFLRALTDRYGAGVINA